MSNHLPELSPLFLTFEGIDGSGKDTVINSLFPLFYDESKLLSSPILMNKFQNVLRTREPTLNTAAGQKIIKQLHDKTLLRQPKKQILNIYLADRKQHSQELKKYLEQKTTILCSRYDLSTYAYQGEAKKKKEDDISFTEIFNSHDYNSSTLVPNLTFYYDLSAEQALKRIHSRNYSDEFETLEKLTLIRKNYLLAINFLQEKQPDRKICIIDASQNKKEVLAETSEQIRNHYLLNYSNVLN